MANEKTLFYLFHEIYMKYHSEMWIRSGEKGRFYSYLDSREVAIDPETWRNPTEWQVFAVLHEIGHIKTNKKSMKRYIQEYLATRWALEESKKIGFQVPDRIINIYQDYIWEWREKAIKRRAKNVVSKTELILR